MKILVTGCLGFIGSKLYAEIEKDHELVGYDIKVNDDIRDRRKLEYLFETENFDIVIHLAALTGVRRGELYPDEYISTNVIGTKNLVELSEKYGVKHFINFSSSSIYGESKKALSEVDMPNPNSIYGMTKLMAEQIVRRSSLEWTTIRPFTVYGENGRPDQVLVKWANEVNAGKPITFYGDGNTVRGYTYLGDLIRGVKLIIEHGGIGTVNLGGTEPISLSELWDIIGNPERDVLELPFGDRTRSVADIEKAVIALGWTPQSDFRKTIKKLWKELCQ